MTTVRTMVVPDCPAERFGRLAPPLLAQEVGAPTLLVARISDDAVLLGRHQRAASALTAGTAAARRAGGGKALRVAPGTVGVLLAVPPGGWTERLDPDKLLNRCVRGLLRGLPKAGAPGGAFYFGRDFVVSQHQQIAAVSQDGTPNGTQLFEALVATTATLALPGGASGYPEHPDPRAPGPPHATLAPGDFARLSGAIVDGYASLLGASPVPEAGEAEAGPPLAPAVDEDETGFAWSDLAPIAIGFACAGVRAAGDRIAEVRLRGDFIAPAYAVADLELALRGKRFELAEIGPVVDASFGQGGAAMVGVRDLRVLADCILAARGARKP